MFVIPCISWVLDQISSCSENAAFRVCLQWDPPPPCSAAVVATVGDDNRRRPVQLFGSSSPRYTVAASRVRQQYAHGELHKSLGGLCNANYVRTAQSCWHLT